MDLSKRFAEASTSSQTISVGSLDFGKNYPILYAKRMASKYGSTVLLTLQTSSDPVLTFLPKRYADAVSDYDIMKIQNRDVSLHLVFKGVYETTKAFVLAVEIFFFVTGIYDMNYQIIVRGDVRPLLTPLPIAGLVRNLLDHRHSTCSNKVHHRSIVQTLDCRSLTGRGLQLRVHQHHEGQILLCWNIMEVSGFYKHCIERNLQGKSAVQLIVGLVERQALVHAVCECVHNYSFL
jgi:hypothetical protein